MPASPIADTVAKIEAVTDRRDLEHIDHLRVMLDDDGTLYDWSERDINTLEYARLCVCKLREIRRSLVRWYAL